MEDNREVYCILKTFLINTEGWPWIQRFDINEDGRNTFLAWAGHYNGDGEFNKRAFAAQARLSDLHYKQEQQFSFEKYTSTTTKIFLTLNKNPRTAVLTAFYMVETMLKRNQEPGG
jgi:hypothetical protein